MATDKSLNLRQLKATEDTAASIADLKLFLEAMQATLTEIKNEMAKIEAIITAQEKPVTKFETVSRPAMRNK